MTVRDRAPRHVLALRFPYDGDHSSTICLMERRRARLQDGELRLHEGGNAYLMLPKADFTKEQISPTRDSRLVWMQSVVRCTHYVTGAGEGAYLNKEETPEIKFIEREAIDRSDEAYADTAPI